MDATCWTIIGGLATAVTGASGFAKKVYGDLKDSRKEVSALQKDLSASHEARIAAAEAHQRELEVLKEMLKRKKKGGPP